jgi:hypothetical protein
MRTTPRSKSIAPGISLPKRQAQSPIRYVMRNIQVRFQTACTGLLSTTCIAIQFDHLVLSCTISSPAPPTPSRESHFLVARPGPLACRSCASRSVCVRGTAACTCTCTTSASASKGDGPQLPISTAPDTEPRRNGARCRHGAPPHHVPGYAAAVEGHDDEVEDVRRYGKVEDQLRAAYQEDDAEGSVARPAAD